MRAYIFIAILMSSCLFFVPAMAETATSAGEVTRITGDSIAQARATDGSMRKLAVGNAVNTGDAIITGKDTSLVILFADGSRFAVGSQTEFVIDRFVYKQGAENDAFHSRLVKGVFRFVSGLIAKSPSKDMKVKVVVATLGIRGTQVEGEVTARHEKNGVMIDASAKVVLLEPEEKDTQTSIIVSNEFGSVVVDQPGYGTEIPDEKSPPSAVRKMQLRTV